GAATEGGDVLLHPAESQLLVEQAVVARYSLRRAVAERRARHEAEEAEAIVDGDDDGLALHGQLAGVVEIAIAGDEGAAVNEAHDRQAIARRDGARDGHVEEETVFIGARGAEWRADLRARAAEAGRVDGAGDRGRGRRRRE